MRTGKATVAIGPQTGQIPTPNTHLFALKLTGCTTAPACSLLKSPSTLKHSDRQHGGRRGRGKCSSSRPRRCGTPSFLLFTPKVDRFVPRTQRVNSRIVLHGPDARAVQDFQHPEKSLFINIIDIDLKGRPGTHLKLHSPKLLDVQAMRQVVENAIEDRTPTPNRVCPTRRLKHPGTTSIKPRYKLKTMWYKE